MDGQEKLEIKTPLENLRLAKAVAIHEAIHEVLSERKAEIIERIKKKYEVIGAKFNAEDEAKVKL